MKVSWLQDKRVLIIILVFLAFASWEIYDYLRPTTDKVSWVDDYENALEKSKLRDKPLMIYFYTDWCSWCRKLERETYNNDQVATLLNENFICLRINAEKHPNLTAQYVIPGFPVTLFLSSNGEELGRIIGYKGPDVFLIPANLYFLND